jgi:hypothetical protein
VFVRNVHESRRGITARGRRPHRPWGSGRDWMKGRRRCATRWRRRASPMLLAGLQQSRQASA